MQLFPDITPLAVPLQERGNDVVATLYEVPQSDVRAAPHPPRKRAHRRARSDVQPALACHGASARANAYAALSSGPALHTRACAAPSARSRRVGTPDQVTQRGRDIVPAGQREAEGVVTGRE